MQTELEAKFLDINPENLRQRLRELGAVLVQPERLMRRYNYDFADASLDKRRGWLRLRDEGTKSTLSYKQHNHTGLTGTQEINVTLDSFQAADELLRILGLQTKAYQETRRESWHFDGTDIEIDTWPWIPTFVELEGQNEHQLKMLAHGLRLDWSTALPGPVHHAYMHYFDVQPEQINQDIKKFTFEEPIPTWLEAKRRKDLKHA